VENIDIVVIMEPGWQKKECEIHRGEPASPVASLEVLGKTHAIGRVERSSCRALACWAWAWAGTGQQRSLGHFVTAYFPTPTRRHHPHPFLLPSPPPSPLPLLPWFAGARSGPSAPVARDSSPVLEVPPLLPSSCRLPTSPPPRGCSTSNSPSAAAAAASS
jgi:hypothetical protein